MAVSQNTQEREAQWQQLQALMRRLQLEDEDPALAIAIANSLRGVNDMDQELAELEQVGPARVSGWGGAHMKQRDTLMMKSMRPLMR